MLTAVSLSLRRFKKLDDAVIFQAEPLVTYRDRVC